MVYPFLLFIMLSCIPDFTWLVQRLIFSEENSRNFQKREFHSSDELIPFVQIGVLPYALLNISAPSICSDPSLLNPI